MPKNLNTKTTLIIIGYGNMAKAIAIALDKNGKYTLEVCGRDFTKAQDFIRQNGLKNAATLESKTQKTQNNKLDSMININVQDKIVLLCVKPYGLGSFSYEGKAKAVYSTLAGVNIATLQSHIKATYFARLMPNIGARYGLSATAVFLSSVSKDSKQEAQEIIESFGNAVFVNGENLIDSAIATSGSSPAFIALIAQSLIDAGVQEGLSRTDSLELVRQTFKGFARLFECATPQEIIEAVTTPAGTTAQGLAVLEKKAIRGAFLQACKASVKKARQK